MRILLIPSAVLMPREMRSTFGSLPTALFPLGRKPMLYHLCEKYVNLVDKVFVVGFERSEMLSSYIEASHLSVEMICLDKLDSLGYTVKYGLNYVQNKYGRIDYAYINFADSLLNDDLIVKDEDYVTYAKLDVDPQWTWFAEKNGYIIDIVDKNCTNEQIKHSGTDKLFIGTFGISDVPRFLQKLDLSFEEKTDLFYQALLAYNKEHKFHFIEAISWFDVGHNENYIKAQSSVAARNFNYINIDESRGLLTKTSVNKKKLIDEIKWYLRLPKQLQYLLPRIYDYSIDFDNPYVTMEYYGYHTLHESLLYGDVSLARWKSIFKKLLFAIKDMQTFKVSGRINDVKKSIRQMYVSKTIDRLEKLRYNESFKIFFTEYPIINGKKHNNLNRIIEMLPKVVDDLLLEGAENYFNIIHGDLCFTNILVEDTYNFMRVIDARGAFGDFDIYGDNRYELAKLLHTLEGNYDYIIEDLFYVSINKNNISYNVSGCDKDILNVFYDIFQEQINNIRDIRLIEATLFLSMIPLHSDSQTRQFAMLATGIELFDKVVEELK